MTKLLLSLHVLAAIVAIGPVTVAASMFPATTRRAFAPAGPDTRDLAGSNSRDLAGSNSRDQAGPDTRSLAAPDTRDLAVLTNLHRICRVYAGLGLLVPVFGLATASSLGVLTDAWLIASMILTAVAAVVLAFVILPGQAAVLTGPRDDAAPGRATGLAGPRDDAGPGRAAGLTGPRDDTGPRRAAARLGMVTGVFNLLWAVVVVLMIVRPGSTTGA